MTVGDGLMAKTFPVRQDFHAIDQFNPGRTKHAGGGTVGGAGRAVMATILADVQFDAKTAELFRKQIQFPFFEYYLKGKGSDYSQGLRILRQETMSGVNTILFGLPRRPLPRRFTCIPAESFRSILLRQMKRDGRIVSDPAACSTAVHQLHGNCGSSSAT